MRFPAKQRADLASAAEKRAGTTVPNTPPAARGTRGVVLAAGAALATAVASAVGATPAASAAPTRSTQSFGAAAGYAVDTAAAKLGASQTILQAGQVGSRSQVPWRLVGPGWTLAEYTDGSPGVARPITLFVIDPAGGKYRIYQWAATQTPWQLIDWSGDKTRALLAQPGTRRPTLHQLVLATGHVTTFHLPSAADVVVGYTRPDGENILVQASDGIERYSLTGALQARLISGSQYSSALSSASGLVEVVNGGDELVLVRNAGGILRRLPVPGADAEFGGCTPVRWWNPTTVLASCMPNTTTMEPRLWLVPISGAAPTALTPLRNGHGPDLGDLDGWRLPSGLYLQALGGCGSRFIGKEQAHGTVKVINVPGSTGNNVVVATSGDRMLVREFSECYPSSSVVWFNPATGVTQQVLRAPANGEGVIAIVAYDRNGEQPGNLA